MSAKKSQLLSPSVLSSLIQTLNHSPLTLSHFSFLLFPKSYLFSSLSLRASLHLSLHHSLSHLPVFRVGGEQAGSSFYSLINFTVAYWIAFNALLYFQLQPAECLPLQGCCDGSPETERERDNKFWYIVSGKLHMFNHWFLLAHHDNIIPVGVGGQKSGS